MTELGMARRIDHLGRIVLPVELRRLYGIRPGDELAITVDGDSIMLRKLHSGCVFCGDGGDLAEFRGKPVCGACRAQIAASQ